MPTFTEELIVERTGDFNNQSASIGGETLVVNHSENGQSPAVTFTNQGGGHFLHQYTFGANSNLPNGVAATFRVDWNGLAVMGQKGVLFYVGDAQFTPNIYNGNFQFVGADVFINTKLTVEGEIAATSDVTVNGTLSAKQINSPTIANLQAAINSVQANSQNSDAAIKQLQADVASLFQAVGLIQAGAGS
ncbi:MAG TPA: hypothetical protein VHU23_00760 [Rhizomicrobium sp.]|jgi:hypothetical protein|nr:hypothetical protein [Rhizomicrobium sp.]